MLEAELDPESEPESEPEPDAAEMAEDTPSGSEHIEGRGYLTDQVAEFEANGGFTLRRNQEAAPEQTPAPAQEHDEEHKENQPEPEFQPEFQPEPEPEGAPESEPLVQEATINLPMGAWLGFHDGDTPIMAKLAVHDPENDYFIFVNRQGIKLRQVGRTELIKLIDNGLVDILETNSNFREEVSLSRKDQDS